MLHAAGPNECLGGEQKPSQPLPPPGQRCSAPQPVPGLTRQPCCAAWAQAAQDPAARPPPAPPPPRTASRGRPRHVDPTPPCCRTPDCAYRGRVGRGNRRAQGPPNGGPWRQRDGSPGAGEVLETQGPPVQGKRVTPDLLGWAVGAVAAGLGRRAIARVCAGAPNTVLAWWVEAADHLKAFSPSVLHAVRRPQVPLDELSALLRAVKEGDGSEAAARTRLARSPPWGWGAIAPVSQLRLALDVGDRPLAMAPPVLHQGGQGWAPGGVPLVLTDGGKAYPTAWLAHGGPCLGGSTRRGARPYGAGAWDTGRPGWCAARALVSTPCGPPAAGRAIPRVWNASPAPAASTGRPVGGASAPAARARTGAAPSWPWTACPRMSACRTPPCARRSRRLGRPRGRARPHRGGPGRQPWQRA